MARLIQIRVAAETFKPEDMEREWPRLCALAWPGEQGPPPANAGVPELARALDEGLRFGAWSKDTRGIVEKDLGEALRVLDDMEKALSDWDPARADKLAYKLEDSLAGIERALPSP